MLVQFIHVHLIKYKTVCINKYVLYENMYGPDLHTIMRKICIVIYIHIFVFICNLQNHFFKPFVMILTRHPNPKISILVSVIISNLYLLCTITCIFMYIRNV